MVDPYTQIFSFFIEWKKQGWSISSVEEYFLQLYIGEWYSVYSIQSYLKTSKYKDIHRRIHKLKSTDYKNIHRRIHKLKKLKLIEEKKSLHKQSVHGAKYYKLSEKGICYIILNTTSFIPEYLNTTQVLGLLHRNYPENFIFQLFMYPYMDYKTIEGIHGTPQATVLWQYLRNCCQAVQDLIDLNHGGEQIFIWNEVQPNETFKFRDLKDSRLAEFLKSRFNLNWLDHAKITKFESNNTLKISYQGQSVIIELTQNKTKASLKINRDAKINLNVSLLRDNDDEPYVFDICVPHQSTLESQFGHLQIKIKQLVSQLVFGLLSYPIIENDSKVISQDKKLIQLVKQVRRDFNQACEKIVNV